MRFGAACGLAAALHVASAADNPPAPPDRPAARPRIGLVLGGGGAQGAAHIGVIKVLDELRIPVDCSDAAAADAKAKGTDPLVATRTAETKVRAETKADYDAKMKVLKKEHADATAAIRKKYPAAKA